MFYCRSTNGENSDCGLVVENHLGLTAETSSAGKNEEADEDDDGPRDHFYMEL